LDFGEEIVLSDKIYEFTDKSPKDSEIRTRNAQKTPLFENLIEVIFDRVASGTLVPRLSDL
jgi:hypothetical protein